MKSIFTYPNNSGTSYIDPNYVGGTNAGFYKRVKELKDGDYKAWNGLAPVATVDEIMSNVSKFYNSFQENWGEVTFYKMWEQPIVVHPTELIQSDISDATVGSLTDVVINFSGNHGFYEDQLMALTGFDGSLAELNGREFYVNKIDADTVKLTNTPDGDPIQLFQGFSGDIVSAVPATALGGQSQINITMDVGTISNGDAIAFTGVNGSWADILNDNTFYAEVISGSAIRLHDSVALDNEIAIYDLANTNITAGTINSDPTLFTHDGFGGLVNGLKVDISGFDGTFGDRYDGQVLYIQDLTGSTFSLSTDLAGSNKLALPAVETVNIDNVTLNADNTVNVTLQDASGFNLLDSSRLTYNNDMDFSEYQEIILGGETTATGQVTVCDSGEYAAASWEETNTDVKLRIYKKTSGVWAEVHAETLYTDGTSIISLKFDSNGNSLIITAQNDYLIYSRNVDTWTQIQTIPHTVGTLFGNSNASISNDGLRITLRLNHAYDIISNNGDTAIYERADTQSVFTQSRAPYLGKSCAISGDGNILAVAKKTPNEVNIYDYTVASEWPDTPTHTISLDCEGLALNTTGDILLTNNTGSTDLVIYEFTTSWNVSQIISGVCNGAGQDNPTLAITSNGQYITGASRLLYLNRNDEYKLADARINHSRADSIGETVHAWFGAGYSSIKFYSVTPEDVEAYDVLSQTSIFLEFISDDNGSAVYKLYIDANLNSPLGWLSYVDINATTTSESASCDISNIPYIATTTGYVEEVDETGANYTALVNSIPATAGEFAQGIVLTENLVPILGDPSINSTTGTLTISSSEDRRYRLAPGTPTIISGGNQTFMQRTGESTYVPNCRVHTSYARGASAGGGYYMQYGQWPNAFDVTEDANGRIQSVGPIDSQFPGTTTAADSIMFQFYTAADTYVAPSQSIAQQQDNWDTESEWDSAGFDTSKEWPRSVDPRSVKMTYNSPSSTTYSQNGTKYVRSAGFTRWFLEVEYPPMTEEQFREYHAVAQQARGQYTPFYFVNRNKYNEPLMFDYHTAGVPTTVRVKDSVVPGDTTVLLEGYSSFESGALVKGEMLTGDSQNGNVVTVVNNEDANAYGEVLAKVPYALNNSKSAGSLVNFNAYHFIVTLDEDDFVWEKDVAGFYYVSVKFAFDEFK